MKQSRYNNSFEVSSYASSVSESDSFNQKHPAPQQNEEKLYNIPYYGEPNYQKFQIYDPLNGGDEQFEEFYSEDAISSDYGENESRPKKTVHECIQIEDSSEELYYVSKVSPLKDPEPVDVDEQKSPAASQSTFSSLILQSLNKSKGKSRRLPPKRESSWKRSQIPDSECIKLDD